MIALLIAFLIWLGVITCPEDYNQDTVGDTIEQIDNNQGGGDIGPANTVIIGDLGGL